MINLMIALCNVLACSVIAARAEADDMVANMLFYANAIGAALNGAAFIMEIL